MLPPTLCLLELFCLFYLKKIKALAPVGEVPD